MQFIAFIPEVVSNCKEKTKISSSLFLLPESHAASKEIKQDIVEAGFSIKGGSYLLFDGSLEGDITPYEIFHGYCLALTFFNRKGRASCRALKEVGKKDINLYIDKFDKFGVGKDDVINFKCNRDKDKVDTLYQRILPHLATKDFNPLRNAIEFFSLFLKEYEIRIRLLYLSICLESLFLENNDNEGLGYKLGLRCAFFLNHFDKKIDLVSTFDEVRIGYNLRSKIIHGNDYQKESKRVIREPRSKATSELDHILIMEKIIKSAFHFILIDNDSCESAEKNTLGSDIDNNLIL